MSASPDVLPPLTDPISPPEPTWLEALSDRVVLPYLVDERDVIFTRLAVNVLTQVVPLSVGMFLLPSWLVGVLAIPYLAYIFARFGGRVVLAVHQVTHRPLFSKRLRRLDRIVTHAMPILWGLTPFAYRQHHVLMHHVENNSEDDLSSTTTYVRDDIWHFLHYWARFTFFGYPHMTSWLARRGKAHEIPSMVVGELAVFAFIALAVWLHPAAGFVVFVTPYLMLRFFLMAGNWTEHAFVDADQPTNSYRNSTCLLNTRYNHRSYNAGYHLIHHVKPGLHWADTVPFFRDHLPKLIEQDSVVFDGVANNQQIWWRLMRHDYEFLADRLVDIGGRRPTREARIAFLKDRVRRTAGRRKGMMEFREARA